MARGEGPKGRIDFDALSRALLDAADRLVPQWLPNGRREGHEWACGDLHGEKGNSAKVNLKTGLWCDFATDERGGDLISLYAAVFNLEQIDAARQLDEQMGGGFTSTPVGPQSSQPAAPKADKRESSWVPVLPVPATAPPAPIAHPVRGIAAAHWDYRNAAGQLLGRVLRFVTSDGGKEVVPTVYARHRVTGRHEWRPLSFPMPRPLYGLDALWPQGPVLIVEGEKCRDAAASILTDGFSIVSWPGGGKAVKKADWTPLAGRSVLIWPDCDAKRYKDGHEKAGELMPEADQPGMQAAETIAGILLEQACKVRIIKIPAPGAKPDGWDVADAVAEGWTETQLITWLRENQRAPGAQQSAQTSACASLDWVKGLICTRSGPKDCRENVIHVLRAHPAWQGAIGYDEFAKRVIVRKPTPLGHAPGASWAAQDDIELSLWISAQCDWQVRSLDTISQAIGYVARLAPYHPVREYLAATQWDGRERVQNWAPRLLGAADTHYHRRVGELFLINMVRRIMEPGCVMRSVMVLEGEQNKGKSRALFNLANPWYSDTMFRVGDKDAFQLIQGVWIYEISELESFNRSEATAVKAFISSTEDHFRAPYERNPERHARQVTFCATTNADEYLKDWSGNTRFWPLRIGDRVELDGIALERDQLFAQALSLYRAGARSYPEQSEFEAYFQPEQDQRLVSHPWLEIIGEYIKGLTRDYVTVSELLTDAMRIDKSRISANGLEAQRAGQVMQQLGWKKRRAGSDGNRSWQWVKPEPARKPGSVMVEAGAGDADADLPV